MKTLGRYWLAISLVATAFATSAALYPMLPAIIATHWNAAGVIDGWMPKLGGVVVAPIGSLVTVACLILFEPVQIEEDGEDLKVRYYPNIVAGVAAIWLFGNLSVLTYDLGWRHGKLSDTAIAVGLLLIVIGNSLGKFSQNRVIGIRTPWSLANEEVWVRTNRVGGWLIVLAGLVMVVTALMGFPMAAGLIALGVAAVVSTAYSYVIWRRINGNNASPS
jgi:uncharacterized membrane protein